VNADVFVTFDGSYLIPGKSSMVDPAVTFGDKFYGVFHSSFAAWNSYNEHKRLTLVPDTLRPI